MTQKSIHTLFHVPFEKLGCIETWINENGHSLTTTEFYKDPTLPNPDNIDWLIVMGGPMGIYDEAEYPWLKAEKEFIGKVIAGNKIVTGICLGAQLIADVLGARVFANNQKEIGWFTISGTENATRHPLFGEFKANFPVFHWHGDTFDLPANSECLYSSDITETQAFLYNNKVLGLQFHLEATADSLQAMVENGAEELKTGDFIQSADEIRCADFIEDTNRKMYRILDYFAGL